MKLSLPNYWTLFEVAVLAVIIITAIHTLPGILPQTITFGIALFLLVGLAAGATFAYMLHHQYTTETLIQLHPNEHIILEKGDDINGVYVMPRGPDGKPHSRFPATRAKIYLTNLGIITEQPGSGIITFFIPLFAIRHIGHEGNYLIIQSFDADDEFIQLDLLTGPDTEIWFQNVMKAVAQTTA
ncbi:Uncharacterised protein [uncultured archaeon]|nr:Uncharacterised protein [uncultured archaeon]